MEPRPCLPQQQMGKSSSSSPNKVLGRTDHNLPWVCGVARVTVGTNLGLRDLGLKSDSSPLYSAKTVLFT